MTERRAWSYEELAELVGDLTSHGVRAGISRSAAKLRQPSMTPGTVVGYDPAVDVALVELDEDVPEEDEEPSQIPAENLTGCPLVIGQRVMFQYQPPHGGFVIAYIGAALRPWVTMVEGSHLTGVASSTSALTSLPPGALYGSPGVEDMFSLSTGSPWTIEALIPAVWAVSGVAGFSVALGTTGHRFVEFLRTDADGSSTTRYYQNSRAIDDDNTLTPTTMFLIPLGPGDTLQMRARQSSGGPIDIWARYISLAWHSAATPTFISSAPPPPTF